MRLRYWLAAAMLLPALQAPPAGADTAADIERGRFLVKIGGCNDCHTPGYGQAEGKVPEALWLTGVPVGFRGPWGTSYPANLRLVAAQLSEEQWLAQARMKRLPPMPWFALAELPERDLRAMYRFIRSLGPAGQPVPAYVAPGGAVATPYILFVPQVDGPKVAGR